MIGLFSPAHEEGQLRAYTAELNFEVRLTFSFIIAAPQTQLNNNNGKIITVCYRFMCMP